MGNNLDSVLLPSFARSCTEISRGFFMSGFPPFTHAVAQRFTPSSPTAKRVTVFTHKTWEKMRLFTE